MLIEVFRSGEYRDSGGNTQFYSKEKLKLIADLYNSRVAEDSSSKAPIVKGHPKSDEPALGWVDYLRCDEDILKAKVSKVDTSFMDEVKSGRYKKISVSLYNNLLLKHIGFLGAAAPAVKGLKDVEYEENYSELDDFELEENEINNSKLVKDCKDELSEFEELKSVNNELKTKNIELSDLNNEYNQRIEELEKNSRLQEFSSFCNQQNQSEKGLKLSPANCRLLTEILEKAYLLEKPTGEDSLVKMIKEFSSNAVFISLKEDFNSLPNAKRSDFSDKNVMPDRMEMHRKILNIIQSNPKCTYEEALNISEA